MITQVSIKDLRGIAGGTVSDLTPLTILTGVNGSGKSTVLESLLIGASRFPGMAIGQAVKRRASRQFTGEWLFRKRLTEARIVVSIGGSPRVVSLRWLDASEAEMRSETPNAVVVGAIAAVASQGAQTGRSHTFFEPDGSYWSSRDYGEELVPRSSTVEARLIDMRGLIGDQREMTDVLSEAKSAGFGDATVELLLNVAPGLRNFEVLKVGGGYEVGLIFDDGAVPLSMAGDGVRAATRLALELAASPTGLVLLEEPEVHQHPGALKVSAASIVAAVKRGLQVVVATHSLELIDELLLSASRSELLDRLSVQKLRITNGTLETTRFEGPESDRIRNVIGTELR
ncbi:MAG: AAA family ATPase [Myxococcus sp.]|nr:AAA family ATPase [Myxococcus sp.]